MVNNQNRIESQDYSSGGDAASYLKLARSAIIDRRVAEVPRGRYMPVSHSLMVCCLVPSLSAIWCWDRPRCRRRAWIFRSSHWPFFRFRFFTGVILHDSV